jgi:putative ABC transport system permease protein
VNIRESARFAVRGVLANKLRSLLTMSGILIGVAAVIILIAAGTGASASVQKSVSSLGSNTLTITSTATGAGSRGGGARGGVGGLGALGGAARAGGAGGFGGVRGGGAASSSTVNNGTLVQQPQLTLDDAQALVDETRAPDVASVAPVVTAPSVTATYEGASHTVGTFTGSTPSYLTNDNDSLQTGVPISDSDYTARKRICVVGTTVAVDLIGDDGSAILGRTVQFNGIAYQVVGVLTAKGSSGPQDQDDRVIAVQDTLTGYGSISSISVKAASSTVVTAAQDEVTAILNQRHHVTAADEDFSIFNPTSILSALGTITGVFTILLGGVAGISLLVGGIGVMNIMLVTVTERTREIGIRKAVGAQKSDIVGQFLLEAVLLSVFGGLLGVVIGVLVGHLRFGTFQLVVAPYSVVLAIGLFFGIYPANRAASLRPIDALRYE